MPHHLLVGLGNPEPRYEATRHNIGFMAVDRFGDRHNLVLSQKKFHGQYGSGFVGSEKISLLEPMTYMNLSGKSVAAARKLFQFEPEQIIVIHDDLDLDPGVVRVKIGGGHGGHNGLRDIIAKIGTRDFIRVRLGIGRPARGAVVDYVLHAFRPDELRLLDEQLDVASDAIEAVIRSGPKAAQNEFNGKK